MPLETRRRAATIDILKPRRADVPAVVFADSALRGLAFEREAFAAVAVATVTGKAGGIGRADATCGGRAFVVAADAPSIDDREAYADNRATSSAGFSWPARGGVALVSGNLARRGVILSRTETKASRPSRPRPTYCRQMGQTSWKSSQ